MFKNIELDKFKKIALLIPSLCFIGMIIGNLTERYRYSGFRSIYHIGWISCYILVFSSITWGIINTIFIFEEKNYMLTNKFIWIAISLSPIMYIGLMLFIAFFYY